MLKAFQKILAEGFKAELLIVGDGPLRDELGRLARDLKISEPVKFLGFRDDIAPLLGVMDLFVLPSIMEGISLTLLEAMAAGKPVVATSVGGNPEVVEDGETGLLVDARDPQGLAEAVGKILSNPQLAQVLGTKGRLRVRERFNGHLMANEYLRLYQVALSS